MFSVVTILIVTKIFHVINNKANKVALIDLPVGKEELIELLLNPIFKVRAYCLVYENLQDSVEMLKGRAVKSGEKIEVINKRIQKAIQDQNELLETTYKAIFKEQIAVKRVKKIDFEDYMVELSKQIV